MQSKLRSLLGITFSLIFVGCKNNVSVPTVYHQGLTFDTRPKMVLVVSFDGLRPDAIAAAGADHIASLAAAGAQARSAHTIVPSITLTSHSSMLAGVGPEKHGIYWNTWVPSNGLIRVPTVFDEAKKRGLKTGMVATKEKFKHLNHVGSLDRFVLEYGEPSAVARAASQIIRDTKPQLLFVHFGHPDAAGHEDGWMSEEQLEVIDEADQALGQIFHTLQDLGMLSSTAVIVTADHGGSGKNHGDASEVSTSIPWIAGGAGITQRGLLEKPVMTYDTAATAAKLLGLAIPADWDGKPVFESAPIN